ncbi:MAG: type VI secretion system baseplate subunit TssF [Lacipirellulaceae bacterium]
MDPRLLRMYDAELRHVREMSAEFARDFPKIAGRLGLEGFACADPYVERLLEGFAFLAARVQLKMDSEFPQLVQNLLEIVYPHLMTPTPSAAIVRFDPDLAEGALGDGYVVPRGSALRGKLVKGLATQCEYRTAHDVVLWPLELVGAEYFGRDAVSMTLPRSVRSAEAGLRLRLRVSSAHAFSELKLDDVVFYLQGSEELPVALYERLVAHAAGVLVSAAGQRPTDGDVLAAATVEPVGFGSEEALLPYEQRSFDGYRLLNEYFTFRERFQFVRLRGIGDALRRVAGREADVTILFDQSQQGLVGSVDASNLLLHCTPAVNLFPRRLDPVSIDSRRSEHHVVPDRTRPLDLEVYQVKRVVGVGASAEESQEFYPFYSLTDRPGSEHRAYYAVRRTPRVISSYQQKYGTRTTYLGSEMYLSLVDRGQAPYRTDMQVVAVEAYCTNRDLPLRMPVGVGASDFTMEIGAPVVSVRCVAGPTAPRPSLAHSPGDMVWKLLSHLGLNYLSITDAEGDRSAATLREMLRLYSDVQDTATQKQIDGVVEVASRPIVRRVPTPGPITFGRGLQITLTFDEERFEGVGTFLLGAVLERFFAKYVSINSFTETTLRTRQRQEVMRWPIRIGRRHIL